ncbi:MAG: hypothetical protein QOF19_2486 [Alphaproteobacteria bacterium]|nr:hypothetical protein [Alphaproteobacteria bacterium]
MKMLIAAVALGAAAVLPAVSVSAAPQGKTHATKHAVKHSQHVRTVRHARTVRWAPAPGYLAARPFASAVHHPSYDVYVNGNYAGSDPDPRIRQSIKREYCQDSLDGC